MARLAVLTPDTGGHRITLSSVGVELAERGHEVVIIGRRELAPTAEEFGLPLHPVDDDGLPWKRVIGTSIGLRLPPARTLAGTRWWIQWQNEIVLQKVPAAVEELGIDGIVADHVLVAAGTVAERARLPLISVCTSLPWLEDHSVPPSFIGRAPNGRRGERLLHRACYRGWRWYIGAQLARLNTVRREWGLAPLGHIDQAHSSLAQLAQLTPSLDFPRADRPAHLHLVGSLTADRPTGGAPAFPHDRLDGRPLILVLLGSQVHPDYVDIFRRALSALGGLGAQVVLALPRDEAGGIRAADLGDIPDDALVVEGPVPQLDLLDRAALLVTHAGTNSTMESLSRGVPVLCLPHTVDHPGMAARVVAAGVGLSADAFRTSRDELRSLARRLLDEPDFGHRARAVAEEIRAAGGAARAAEVIAAAVETGMPVPGR